MSFIKFAAPVAALVASVAADCSFSATTISAPSGVSALATCSQVSGNVVFASGAAAPTLDLSGIQSIDGDLTYTQDDSVSLISAPQLTEISGAINFNNLSRLADLELTSLQKSGDVTIENCGGLSTVTTGMQYSQAGVITISNTYLNTLGGFGNLSSVKSVLISGNPLLADITMNIGMVNSITIGSNQVANSGLSVKFDNLTMADTINVQNASSISFASLMTVANDFYAVGNDFQTFALPNLTDAGGIVITGNNALNNISLPQLQAVNGTNGTFYISNNTALQTIGGFPKLTNCAHDVFFAGTFTNVTDISQLKSVAGAMSVISTQNINTTCQEVQHLHDSLVIRGKPTCSGGASNAEGGGASSSSGSSGSSSSSSAAAVPINIPALPVLGAGFGAFLLEFLLSF